MNSAMDGADPHIIVRTMRGRRARITPSANTGYVRVWVEGRRSVSCGVLDVWPPDDDIVQRGLRWRYPHTNGGFSGDRIGGASYLRIWETFGLRRRK